MTAYEGRVAELYDVFYAEKDYAAEARFVDEAFRKVGIPAASTILDLACGTGRHARELTTLGYRLVGVDRSEGMLRSALASGPAPNPLAGALARGDMRAIPLSDGSVAGATCLFDSIGYAVTNAGVRAALNELARVIARGGALVAEFWHAPAMLGGYDPVRVRRWPRAGGEVIRISETSLSIPQQLAEVRYSILDLGDDGSVERWTETHVNRYFQVQEMAGFLATSGFEPVAWYPGFAGGHIDQSTWHVVVVAVNSGERSQEGI